MHASLVYFCQLTLISLIWYQELKVNFLLFFAFAQYTMLFYARFICALMLHLFLLPECTGGLSRMKYVLNHPYKFNNSFMPFMLGLC